VNSATDLIAWAAALAATAIALTVTAAITAGRNHRKEEGK